MTVEEVNDKREAMNSKQPTSDSGNVDGSLGWLVVAGAAVIQMQVATLATTFGVYFAYFTSGRDIIGENRTSFENVENMTLRIGTTTRLVQVIFFELESESWSQRVILCLKLCVRPRRGSCINMSECNFSAKVSKQKLFRMSSGCQTAPHFTPSTKKNINPEDQNLPL